MDHVARPHQGRHRVRLQHVLGECIHRRKHEDRSHDQCDAAQCATLMLRFGCRHFGKREYRECRDCSEQRDKSDDLGFSVFTILYDIQVFTGVFCSTARPAKLLLPPRASSIRNASFHLAMRSDRAKEPTLSCPASHPAAKWTMVTSSVSPERAETMVPQPARFPASSAAFVSVMVPA